MHLIKLKVASYSARSLTNGDYISSKLAKRKYEKNIRDSESWNHYNRQKQGNIYNLQDLPVNSQWKPIERSFPSMIMKAEVSSGEK